MIAAALQAQLRALRREIEFVPHALYVRTPGRSSGSVGQHVRHVADHVRALLAFEGDTAFSYDARLRGTRIETDPAAAADELVGLCIALDGLDDQPFDRPATLHLLTEPGAPSSAVATTLGREAAFVLQHTIHHCALIAVLLEGAGVGAHGRFGYAASTPVHR